MGATIEVEEATHEAKGIRGWQQKVAETVGRCCRIGAIDPPRRQALQDVLFAYTEIL